MSDILALAKKIGVDLGKKKIAPASLQKGMEEEMKEHGSPGKFDVLHGDKTAAAKVALAHLVKNPKYYDKE